jgi:hypothetical protein
MVLRIGTLFAVTTQAAEAARLDLTMGEVVQMGLSGFFLRTS